MLITKKAIPRRTLLKGLGATLALPLLDAMVPPLTALQDTAARPVTRFGVMYVPNGMVMNQWTPAAEGASFELTPTLAPLAPYKNDLLVLSNLACVPTPGRPGGAHAKASTRFLTDVSPPTSETWLDAGISMDQIIARQMSAFTQLGSLELAVESGETAGACDVGFACAYTNTISWLGREHAAADGEQSSDGVRAFVWRQREHRSPCQAGTRPSGPQPPRFGERRSGAPARHDRSRRPREARRVSRCDSRRGAPHPEGGGAGGQELPRSIILPASPRRYDDHVKLMCDLQVLAYQADLTRVVTFMLGREFSGVTYPQIGVPDAHHPITHHQQEAEKIAKVVKINALSRHPVRLPAREAANRHRTATARCSITRS